MARQDPGHAPGTRQSSSGRSAARPGLVAATIVGLAGLGLALGPGLVEPTPPPGGAALTERRPDPSGTDQTRAARSRADQSRVTQDSAIEGDGTYLVGTDIQPGTYMSRGSRTRDDSSWYWGLTKGEPEGDVVDSDFGRGKSGTLYVTITSGDSSFITSGVQPWVPAEEVSYGIPATSFAGDGTYRVGSDIEPGTYRAFGDRGFWRRLASATGWSVPAIAEDYDRRGPEVVTISRTDAFFATRDFGRWERVD